MSEIKIQINGFSEKKSLIARDEGILQPTSQEGAGTMLAKDLPEGQVHSLKSE